MDARILIFGLAAAASAVDISPPLGDAVDERHETAHISPMSANEKHGDVLRFQAEERKIFYDDLAVEKKRLENEWSLKARGLLEKQREARREFKPQEHSIEERRAFYLSQRSEMAAFRKEHSAVLKALKEEQKKKREGFHKRQAEDRKI